jgi:hypothetical protein
LYEVEPYDEPRIADTDTIIRRINPEHHVVPDENRGVWRVSSKAYGKSSGPKLGMSVDIEALIEADGVNARSFVTTPVYTASIAFRAETARAVDLIIGYEPIIDVPGLPDNPYHGEVWTREPSKRFSKSQTAALASSAWWYVELPGVEIV